MDYSDIKSSKGYRMDATSAGQIAIKLDQADNTADKKIAASIWNNFASEHGLATIEDGQEMDIKKAWVLITRALVSAANGASAKCEELAKEWLNGAPAAEGEVSEGRPAEETAETPPPAAAKTPVTPATSPTTQAMEEQTKADYESVKVTVPKKIFTAKPRTDKAKVDAIVENRKEAKNIAAEIKKINIGFLTSAADKSHFESLLKKITKDNVAYVLNEIPDLAQKIDDVDSLGTGFDKEEVVKYLLEPLAQRADELGFRIEKNGKSPIEHCVNAKDWPLYDITRQINTLHKAIIGADNRTVKNDMEVQKANSRDAAAVYSYNTKELPKIQKVFDDATHFMAEVANMSPKPEVKSGEKESSKWKQVKLSDGRYITVEYDKTSGEIANIRINYDTTPDHRADGTEGDGLEVRFDKDEAYYNTDKSNNDFEGHITSGYDFEKLKELAKKIFG